MRLAEFCSSYLIQLALIDDDIWLLDGDLADSYGAENFAKSKPENFIMCGICEQNMISVAAGMASMGLKPWVFSFSAFLCFRGLDQIRTCISQTNMMVVLVGSHSGGFTGKNGQSHSALNDICIIRSLPNISIWSPYSSADVIFSMEQITSQDKAAYLRLPREELLNMDIKKASDLCYWATNHKEISLIATGLAVDIALKIKKILAEKGVSLGIINCIKVHPLPFGMLKDLLKEVKYIFTIEDHYRDGGFGSIVEMSGIKVDKRFGWEPSYTGKAGNYDDMLTLPSVNPEIIALEILQILN
ncbi:transketolase family protein [Pedobacter sp. SAFR-022]|uniref:transketolase family protein n=1 Tax=Pedobacter sp. SAFR-022 TaxID=3436861 RepID=UPI003F7DF7B7